MGELESLQQKVAEAVARKDAADAYRITDMWLDTGSVTFDHIAPAESETRTVEPLYLDNNIGLVQAMLVRLEALEAENNPALAVLKHIVEDRCEEPLAFIEAWYEGNFDALREEWDGVPDAVFDGADPLFKRNSNDQN